MPFPNEFELSSLTGTNGFRINGEAANDFSGRSVSSAGDVNGDGFGDLIIGAPLADPNSNNESGASYVVLGLAPDAAVNWTGAGGNQKFYGGAGNDTLDGGEGNDILTGGAGIDRFVFTAASDGRDTIRDFVLGTDKIAIDGAGFGIGSIVLHANGTPTVSGAGGQFLYDTDDGRLSFDSDGAGGAAAVWFATLTGAPVIAVTDFELV